MKRYLRILLVLSVIIISVAAAFFIYDRQVVFTGDKVKNPDCYVLKFEKMNQTDSHTLMLQEGDTLSVDFSIDRGHADLFIGMDGEEMIYRANDITSGAFELTVPKDGDYRITVQAKHASGSVMINAHGKEE